MSSSRLRSPGARTIPLPHQPYVRGNGVPWKCPSGFGQEEPLWTLTTSGRFLLWSDQLAGIWATPIAAVDSVVGGKRMDALRNTWHNRAIHLSFVGDAGELIFLAMSRGFAE